MKRVLPQWNKDIKKEMIQRDMGMSDLSAAMNVSRVYLSEIINNRKIAPEMAIRIGRFFGIPHPEDRDIAI